MKGFYLQDCRGYVGNDILWWAKDGRRYTTDLSKAEIFTKDDALKQHRSRISDIPWPKSYIDQKTRPAVDMQYVRIDEALNGTGIDLVRPEKPKREQYRADCCGRFVSEEEYYTRVYAGNPCRHCD